MKKLLILVVSVLAVFTAIYTVSGLETTSTVTTNDYTQFDTTQGNLGYFTDYNEYLSSLYAQVYDDIYEDIYNEIMLDIDAEFYEEIYSLVESKTDEFLNSEEISVYIDDFQQAIYNTVNVAKNSVYAIISYLGTEAKGIGSGVVYKYNQDTNEYFLITNYHVVEEGNNFSIVFSDESEYVGTLIGFDTEVDIAILKFSAEDKTNITVSTLGDSQNLTKGSFLVAAGNPRGLDFYGSVNLGIISGLNRKIDSNQYVDYIQHDSAINPGNSGGPAYNFNGEVIGINVAKFANTEIEGMGFAIPINLVKRIIERIENNDWLYDTIMPRLGANYYDVVEYLDNGFVSLTNLTINGNLITEPLTLALPSSINNGFIVSKILDSSTLSSSAIKSGDLVVKIDDFTIIDNQSYYDYMYANHEAGDVVVIYYYELNHDNLEYNSTLKSIEVTLK